jgi:hypothetical protein
MNFELINVICSVWTTLCLIILSLLYVKQVKINKHDYNILKLAESEAGIYLSKIYYIYNGAACMVAIADSEFLDHVEFLLLNRNLLSRNQKQRLENIFNYVVKSRLEYQG